MLFHCAYLSVCKRFSIYAIVCPGCAGTLKWRKTMVRNFQPDCGMEFEKVLLTFTNCLSYFSLKCQRERTASLH